MIPAKATYNFIASFGFLDVYDVFFDEFKTLPHANFISVKYPKGIRRVIEKFLFSSKTYFLFPASLRKHWLRRKVREYQNLFADKRKPLCFIFPLNYFRRNKYGLVEAIREVFPTAKVIYFFTDLISLTPEKQRCARAKGEADLMYSYDPVEAQQYGILYHAVPYSDVSSEAEGMECLHDICFVGQAKNRFADIICVYEYLSSHGVDCDFHIIGVPGEQRKYADKIHYCEKFSYRECLRITARSRCILECIQAHSTGHTARVPEAIIFGRKLLSNNPHLNQDEYFDAEHMRIFSRAEDIEIPWLKDRGKVCYPIDKERLSPLHFLRDIEKRLHTS